MSTHRATIEIDAPPGAVYSFLVEPDLLGRWVGGFVSSEPLTDGPVGVGTRSSDLFTEGGREVRMTTEITAFDPPRRLEVVILNPFGEAVSDYRLEGSAPTRVTHSQTMRLRGIYRLMLPFLGRTMRKRLVSDLAALKSAVEARQLPTTTTARPIDR